MNLTDPNEIKALMAANGVRFSKSLGQNFLIAPWVPEKIADAALLESEDAVIEIGPGVGVLTRELACRAADVLSIELDETLRPILRVTLMDRPNCHVLYGDALKQNYPSLCREYFGAERKVKLCANLPYNVTTPLLTAFLESGCFELITVMIQKEVAERICAGAGTAEYGAFTLLVNWYSTSEKLFDVSPDCFLPQPKVTSSVIRLRKRTSPAAEVADVQWFFRVIRAAFNQRRKALPNALSAGLGLDKAAIAEALSFLGLRADIRGERLTLDEFAALSNLLKK